jgi:hypothetical protein
MKKTLYLFGILTLFCVSNVFAQLNLPRESQRQSLSQVIGDTTVSIVYHRPNTKARKVWGELVPLGAVWRTGANEATVFEVSNDVKINGQLLPKGKYSLHTIPAADEWTIIFSKKWEQWGSFTYDAKDDALRVKSKPVKVDFQETMSFGIENSTMNTAQVFIAWEKVKVPFTIDVGDVGGRTLAEIRKAMTSLKPDDLRTPGQAANWVLTMKMAANYEEALGWLDAGIKNRETYGLLYSKARLQKELGKTPEAIMTAEKAIQVGKAATPVANTANLEKMLAEWKAKK